MKIEQWENLMSVNFYLEDSQKTFFLKIKMFDNRLAELNNKMLSRIFSMRRAGFKVGYFCKIQMFPM